MFPLWWLCKYWNIPTYWSVFVADVTMNSCMYSDSSFRVFICCEIWCFHSVGAEELSLVECDAVQIRALCFILCWRLITETSRIDICVLAFLPKHLCLVTMAYAFLVHKSVLYLRTALFWVIMQRTSHLLCGGGLKSRAGLSLSVNLEGLLFVSVLAGVIVGNWCASHCWFTVLIILSCDAWTEGRKLTHTHTHTHTHTE